VKRIVRGTPLWGGAVRLRDAIDRRAGTVYRPRRYWESHADEYVAERLATTGAERAEIAALVNAIAVFTPARVLEVGCAYGRLARIVAESDARPAVVGADLSAQMLDHARTYLAPLAVPLVQADASHLPFADRAFDVVYTYGLMMHVAPQEIAQVVAELTRVASRGIACLETALPDGSAARRTHTFSRSVFAYDYRALFAQPGWTTVAEGRIGRRIWFACAPGSQPTA
jgi:ubiquinone/menaquinone biosynthesis C-methylase UbiE